MEVDTLIEVDVVVVLEVVDDVAEAVAIVDVVVAAAKEEAALLAILDATTAGGSTVVVIDVRANGDGVAAAGILLCIGFIHANPSYPATSQLFVTKVIGCRHLDLPFVAGMAPARSPATSFNVATSIRSTEAYQPRLSETGLRKTHSED